MTEHLLLLWNLIAGMSPYLLFGFLCAGILHVIVPHKFYNTYLSQNNVKSITLAALFGIPLPLCSCGVLPTAMSLRKEGASKSATVSFLTATPQTGIDSILATYSVFGLAFAIIRPIAALVTSFFAGCVTAVSERNNADEKEFSNNNESCEIEKRQNKVLSALQYGYVTMLQDIGTHLVVGMVLAGCIAVFVPDSFFLQYSDMPILEMIAVVVVAIPMYVCATGSIPIAAALMMKGLTPGAALVFLMAGPAVSFASMVVVKKVMGTKTMLLYICSIVFGAISFGLLIDYGMPSDWFSIVSMTHNCHHEVLPLWKLLSAIIFIALLLNALLLKYKPKQIQKMGHIYSVKGMSCNHCKSSVETNLAKLDGVKSVTADLATGNVTMEGVVSDEQVRKTVEDLGFEFGGKLQ